MSKVRGGKPSPEGARGILEVRRRAFDKLSKSQGRKRPGSLSGRKQA